MGGLPAPHAGVLALPIESLILLGMWRCQDNEPFPQPTLYLCVGSSYFADESGEVGGTGVPKLDTWSLLG